jgi:hypothetical protein
MPAAAVALAVAADVLAAVRTVQTEGDGSGDGAKDAPKAGWCRLTVSKPLLTVPMRDRDTSVCMRRHQAFALARVKAPMVSALEATI